MREGERGKVSCTSTLCVSSNDNDNCSEKSKSGLTLVMAVKSSPVASNLA